MYGSRLVPVSQDADGNEIAMHDLIVASSLVVMLIAPCFAAMKQDTAEDSE
jgi:hypothetical protein